MVKAIWAVACAVVFLGGTTIFGPGCATVSKGAEKDPAAGSGKGRVAAAISFPRANLAGAGEAGGPGAYRIGPEDVLRVIVWDNKELTVDVTVRPDGKISIPLVQDIQAEGLNAAELATVISNRLDEYLKQARVSVIVTQINYPKVYVIGSVAKPGFFLLRSDMSVLQALSLAGGFTQFASPRSIRLVRSAEGKQTVKKINYYEIVDEDSDENYLLKPGDTIVVP